MGPRLRQRLRQHHPLGFACRRGLHARPRRRQSCNRGVGGSAVRTCARLTACARTATLNSLIALLGFLVSMTVAAPRHAGRTCLLLLTERKRLVRAIADDVRRRVSGSQSCSCCQSRSLMGGTLTLLIRHLVRQDVSIAPARIARLYAVNTVGAALGSFLTDFALVPAVGLLRTQMVAVALNVAAGAAALALALAAISAMLRRHRRSQRPRRHSARCLRPQSPIAPSFSRASRSASPDSRRWAWRSCGFATRRSCWADFARSSRCC